MGMALKHTHLLPILLPVPGFHSQVVRAGQNERAGRVNSDATDVVGVGRELGYTFEGVVIEDSYAQIIRANNNPILSSNEPDTSHYSK